MLAFRVKHRSKIENTVLFFELVLEYAKQLDFVSLERGMALRIRVVDSVIQCCRSAIYN